MADQEDSGFKVTDRRKFNADGTPRGAGVPATAEETPAPAREQAADNVVSFPSDTSKKPPESSATPHVGAVTSDSRPAAAQPATGQVEQAYNKARGPKSTLPEASFLSLVNMLAVEAAMHLGLIQTPGEEAPPPDLEAARHLIDMLSMIQEKTRGNLTSEEAGLLENILADLRMQFVAVSRGR